MAATGVYEEIATLFLGDPKDLTGKAKSTIVFGCETPAKDNNGKDFKDTFNYVESNSTAWFVQPYHVQLGGLKDVVFEEKDLSGAAFSAATPGILFPKA